MATPSIQTLITQAQQVLNLQSSNEIRATLAAVLANANVGTPLNPNLTTQQLWDEFDEIVRQSTDDIMSIVVDQMMRMVFSPPAPGGAGADKQVIFNDGGVLAGDAGLTYNKATDALTITGDLTVDTSTLKVDSTNNRVGIGTASPGKRCEINQSANAITTIGAGEILRLIGDDGNVVSRITEVGFGSGPTGATYAPVVIGAVNTSISGFGTKDFYVATRAGISDVAPLERYRIDSTGISTWSVAGTTAMTLNSTGLGVKGTIGTSSGDAVIAFGARGVIVGNAASAIASGSYIDIAVITTGNGYQGFLSVANTLDASANVRTQTTYSVFGRGTSSTITQIATDNGSSGGASFTVTTPSNGVIRITNTSGFAATISAQFFGGTSL